MTNGIKVLSVEEIQKIFPVGRNSIYELMHRDDFPSFKIGKQYFVESNALALWIKEQSDAQYKSNKPY